MMVRKGGFEPPRLSAPPPQDGVSASSTTSAFLIVFTTEARRHRELAISWVSIFIITKGAVAVFDPNLPLVADNRRERLRGQTRSTYQRAINFRFRHQRLRVFRLD